MVDMPLPELIKPVIACTAVEQVTDAELSQFAALIYSRTGIRVSPQKKTLLSNRLRRRLRDTGIDGFAAYYRHVKGLPAGDPEWNAFLQAITTHETYLFRDEGQWEWFRKEFLAGLAAEAPTPGKLRSLRIWSAACSTGDEPVTAACCIAACLPNAASWRPWILGTDIGAEALEQARNALFGERAMRLVPADYRTRFFTKAKDAAVWQARACVADWITYRQHNLLEPLRERPFDLVFLKNVLIYFDAASKQRVLANIRAAVRPGGLVVAGAAEGVGDLLKDFQRLQPWLYRKPKEQGASR